MISLPDKISETIRTIIETTGRDVTFETILYGACSVCSGTDAFCASCYGTGTTSAVSGYRVKAKIEWKDANRRLYRSASHDFEGDVRLTIAYDDRTYFAIRSSKYAIVDQNRCKINAVYPGGVNINRIYVLLTQEEQNKRVG